MPRVKTVTRKSTKGLAPRKQLATTASISSSSSDIAPAAAASCEHRYVSHVSSTEARCNQCNAKGTKVIATGQFIPCPHKGNIMKASKTGEPDRYSCVDCGASVTLTVYQERMAQLNKKKFIKEEWKEQQKERTRALEETRKDIQKNNKRLKETEEEKENKKKLKKGIPDEVMRQIKKNMDKVIKEQATLSEAKRKEEQEQKDREEALKVFYTTRARLIRVVNHSIPTQDFIKDVIDAYLENLQHSDEYGDGPDAIPLTDYQIMAGTIVQVARVEWEIKEEEEEETAASEEEE